jgi:predicted PolB exonuclease-like 3'-5' exonuclease
MKTILYYFNNVIKPTVIQNGKRIDVPVIYANSERWNQIQKNGYFRDKKDKIMMPLITFKRTNIEKK